MKKGLSSSIGDDLYKLIERAGYFKEEKKTPAETLGSLPKSKRNFLMKQKSVGVEVKGEISYADVIDWYREEKGVVVEVVPSLTEDGDFIYCGKSTNLFTRTTKHYYPSRDYIESLNTVLISCLDII